MAEFGHKREDPDPVKGRLNLKYGLYDSAYSCVLCIIVAVG